MTITIFGAKAIVGRRLVKMALAKNYIVKAFDRNIEDLIDSDLRDDNFIAIKGYVFDKNEVLKAVKESDAIVSCIEGSKNSTDKSRSLGLKNIIEAMQKADVNRIVAMSGIGILNYDEERLAIEMEDFPEELKEVSSEHLIAYKYLKSTNLDWTLVCASNIIDKDFTANYEVKENYLSDQSNSNVNAGDIADFILKVIQEKSYIKSRVGISIKS